MTKTDEQLKALSPEAHAMYKALVKQWEIRDAGGLITALTAAQALDRMRQAQKIIAAVGITVLDRFGQSKPNVACQIEKESRAGLLMALKALNVDLESLDDEDGHAA